MKMLAIGLVLGVVLAVTGAVLGNRETAPVPAQVARVPTSATPSLGAAESAQIAELLERVRREYVDDVQDPALIDGALRGMVSGLDPYSSYLDAEQYADLRVSTAGSYAGIGIEVSTADRALRVVRPFRDSPAELAGIRSGDMISAIDGAPVGSDLDAAMARMRGPRGSRVKLHVMRPGQVLPLEFTVERAQVDVHSVVVARLPGSYLYVRISGFSDTTASDLAAGVARARRDLGAKPRGLVLDLRNNPGGVLEAAVEVADQFLEGGVIVSAEGRTPASRFTLSATPGEMLTAVPVVALVNGGTASAAEILAGALKDHGRATLLGKRTFGKGSVQTVMPLSAGRAVKLTTSRYFTASGRPIQGHGIEPDREYSGIDTEPLDLDDARTRATLAERDAAVRAALALLKGHKPGAAPPGLTASAARNRK